MEKIQKLTYSINKLIGEIETLKNLKDIHKNLEEIITEVYRFFISEDILPANTLDMVQELSENNNNIPQWQEFIEQLRVRLVTLQVAIRIPPKSSELSILIQKNHIQSICNWIYKLIENSYLRIDKFLNEKKQGKNQSIQSIFVKKYLCLSNVKIIDIPVDADFIVFTGANGEGKTALLQAITLGICKYELLKKILPTDDKLRITIYSKLNGQNIINDFNILQNYTETPYYNPLSDILTNPNVVGYGASRLQLQGAMSQSSEEKISSPVYGLFESDSILLNIDVWLREQKVRGNNKIVANVITTLKQLMPSIDKIIIGESKDNYPISYKNQDGTITTSKNLSAGNKSILAMIGDMIIRLYQQQPEVLEVSDLQGIVLIDELETHLHPKWQLKLPSLLAECFPKVQFIVTTHSPIIVLGMPENTVYYNVNKDKGETTVEKVDIDVSNLLPNQVLTSPIFNMESILSVQNKNIGEVRTENTFDEIKQRDEVRKKLREIAEKLQQKR